MYYKLSPLANKLLARFLVPEFRLMDYVTVKPGKNGVSVVTATIPSHMVLDVMHLCDLLFTSARWLRMRCRSSEAIYKARELRESGVLK